MSLALQAGFPSVSPLTVVLGAGYAQASSFLLQRPVVKALCCKAKESQDAKETLHSPEAKICAISLASNLAASAVQSYGLAALLQLGNVINYKGAVVVGTLALAAQNGPKLVTDVLVKKEPLKLVVSTLAVQVLDTVGLALFLQWYTQRGNALPKISV